MAGSPIDDARAAGYSDAEINDYLAPKIATAKAAGYSDDEINAHLGVTPAPEKEPNFFVRYGLATPDSPIGKDGLVKVVTDMPQNIVDWFKKTPDALTQSAMIHAEMEKQDKAYEEATGTKLAPLHHAPGVRELQLSDPMSMAFAPGEGLYRGFGKGGIGDLAGKPGVPQPVTIGKVPEPADFNDAATALAGRPAAAIESKLEQTFDEHGIHPAEVVDDASRDITVTQDLMASNRDVPTLYTGGKPPAPPEPPAKLPAAIEPPEPPPAGSAAEARQKILDKISVGETHPGEPMTFERLYTQMVDDLNPVKRAVKEATDGEKLPPGEDPYTLMRLTRGTFGKADQMIERGTYDFNTYKTNGAALKDILAPVADDLDGLRAYAASKRAIELNGRGIDSGFDLEAAQKVAAAGKKYEPVLRGLVDYQNKVTQYLRDSGVLSEKAYQSMLEANKDYVPFFRVMHDGVGGRAGGGFGGKNPIKAIKGSQRDVVDPIESVIKNTYAYVSIAERNAAGLKLIDVMKKADEGAGYERNLIPNEPGKTVLDPDSTRFLEEHGVKEPTPDLVAFIKTAGREPEGDTISAYRDGVREEYKVADPDLLKAYRGLDQQSADMLTKVLAIPARTLRAGAVLTPDFMAKNLIRDLQTAFINSKGVFSPVDTAKGLAGVLRKDADFEAWMKGGGANSAMVTLDRQYLQQQLLKLDSETGLMSRAWNVIKSPIEGLRMVSEFAENATRLGEFKKALGGATDKASIQEAAFASREVTLDFARIGASMRAYNMISAFANANIQGVDRLARAFGEKPFGTTARIAAGVTLPSMLLWWANHDDPRYKELPAWQKDMFWIVMTQDHIYRLPKPFETGVAFGSGPERILDAYFGHNPDALKGFANSVIQALTPGVVPTAAAPILDQFANRNSFTGGPLIPDRLEKQLPEYQYNPYTTELAKTLGSLIGAFPGMRRESIDETTPITGGMARALTSPALIENYVRAWTGGLGSYALQLTDTALRKAGALPDPPQPAATLADIPVVKAFVVRYPSASAQSIQDFYDQYAQNKTIYTTIQARAAEGDADAVEKLTKWAPEAMEQLDGFAEVLGTHAQIIRNIYKDPDMSPSDKRQTIDTLYFHMIELAQAGKEALNAAKSVAQ